MKKFWTPVKIVIVVLFIIVAIGIPFIINMAYSVDDECVIFETIWGAEEVFGFWGELVGAGATILALIYTIMYTEYQRVNERKESCKPHLSTSMDIWEAEDIRKKQWNYDYAIVFGKDVDIHGLAEWPPIIKTGRMIDNIKSEDYPKETFLEMKLESAKARLECVKDHLIIEYFVKNVGIGTAIDITLYVDGKKTILPFSLVTAETRRILLICNLEKIEKEDEWDIELKFDYLNVYRDSKFTQKEIFHVYRDEKELLCLTQDFEQTLSKPIEVEN